MWLLSTPTVTFTDINGNSYPIKDMKVIPVYDLVTSYQVKEREMIDEIASRPEFYGTGNEILSFQIFEANVADIVDNGFDLSKLKTLKIPIVRQ